MHKLVLATVTIGATLAAAAPRARRTPKGLTRPLVFRIFDPGAMPGAYGRTTLVLTTTDDQVSLAITTERPPPAQRGQQNPTEWRADPNIAARLDGVVKARRNGFTFWLEQPATADKIALVCTHASAPVHAAGATVQPGRCSPCYDSCRAGSAPVWTPARTRRTRGLECVLRSADDIHEDGTEIVRDHAVTPALPTLGVTPTRLFFTPAPGVEHLVGPTDCPPEGLRDVR